MATQGRNDLCACGSGKKHKHCCEGKTEKATSSRLLLAIVSSLNNRPLPAKLVAFGEIGLAGEIRPAPRGQERLKEAAKLGFTHAMIPKANAPKQPIKGIEVIALDRIEQAIDKLREY